MIDFKSPKEIEIMRQGGKILRQVLSIVVKKAKAGIRLTDLDKTADEEIVKRGAFPSFKMIEGYKWSICACVNQVVVHGVPNSYSLKDGDILGLDCGVFYKGFHTDAAQSIKIGKVSKKKDEFLTTGYRALKKAIGKAKVGNYIYDISKTIQDTIESKRYSVVRTLVGHGIGKDLHQEPEIPCFTKGKRKDTAKILDGMTLAVEVIYNMGSHKVKKSNKDRWTIETEDGKISGLFEVTVATTHHGCIILT